MKKIKSILFFLLICSIIGYLFVNCVNMIEKGSFGLTKDRSGRIKVLNPGFNFIWEGVVYRKRSIYYFRQNNSDVFNLELNVVPFTDQKKDLYTVRASLNVNYEIDYRNLHVLSIGHKEGNKIFYNAIEKILNILFEKELYPYFFPDYLRIELNRDLEKITKRIIDAMGKHFEKIGIKILGYNIIGNIYFPGLKEFTDAKLYCNEIRRVKENNYKEMLKIQNVINRKKLLNEHYFDKLERISRIIKDDPDILKYIYIDKMAKNVRVIIASDKSGMPFDLDYNNYHMRDDNNNNNNNSNSNSNNVEIDNFHE